MIANLVPIGYFAPGEPRDRLPAMKLVGTRLFGMLLLAIVVAGAAAASAQPVSFPCTLVCFPPAHLNARKCTCEEARPKQPACSLVCLNPGETLDARKCACVRAPR